MAHRRSRSTAPVVESVLDRLLQGDDVEGERDPEASLSRFRESVLRDVEWLLNTRRVHETGFEEFAELKRSVYGFGLPDLSSFRMGADSQRALARSVEDALRTHEPRIARLRVSLQGAESASRRLRLTIEGVLQTGEASEPITFDTLLDMGTGQVSLLDA